MISNVDSNHNISADFNTRSIIRQRAWSD